MKKIFYLASFDIRKRTGGGLAALCYYNALCYLYSGKVDLVLPEECCTGAYKDAIALPARKSFDYIKDFSLHRGKSFIKKYLKKHASDYDVCFVNCSRYGGDMMNIFEQYGIKVVTIHHNYEVEYCMTNKYNITLFGRFPYIVSYYESSSYKRSAINCYLTKSDQKLITEAYGESKGINTLLGVFDYQPMTYVESKKLEQNTIVISGSLCDYQTYKSIEEFSMNYYDAFHNKHPELKLLLTGRNPHTSIWDFQKKNPSSIEVVPSPDDIDRVIDRATIFLCPTSIGGGLKLRVMDGLRKGLPVLVHRVSARGYDSFYGKPFFQVYDDVNSFMNGLDRILDYIKLNVDYSQEIIEAYKKVFSFEAGVERVKGIINSL